MADQKKPNRPSIRALLEPSESNQVGVKSGQDDQVLSSKNKTEYLADSPLEGEEEQDYDEVLVPGTIPADVKPLQSQSDTGVIPRYQQALARGEQRSARLAFAQLGNEGATRLAEVLSSGTARSLEGLDASCNSIGPAGASAISRSIAANSVLRALDLSANAIEDAGATALAEALRSNAVLQHLDLHACAIRCPGAAALAHALSAGGGAPLASLNLRANYIADAGATALAGAIRKSRGLRCLVTSSNDIGRPGQACAAPRVPA